MPGRVATRGSRTASTSTRKSTRNISSRDSDALPEIPVEGEDSTLRRAICAVFADAQRSTATHRKAIVSLRKVQESCCYEAVNHKTKQSPGEDFDEDDFNREIVRCVLRLLPVRKAEQVGDRMVRFLGTFLNVASGKDNRLVEVDNDDTVPETPTSRLTTTILTTLLPMLSAKDKIIRFRATQITSHIINSMDTLDDSLFRRLKQALLRRIYDKEAPVRLQAVYGLGRLAAEVEEDDNEAESDSDEEVRAGVLEKLLHVLQNDPAAEVRRNLLLNLPLTKEVLPYLLERARDADGSTRRALYARLLPALGDFRHLSLTHREKLLRWGLRDRDEKVRQATARLFRERWIEDCAALPAADADEPADSKQPHKASAQAAAPSLDALLELLERIDIVNSGIEGGIAQTAMKEFWSGRPDYVDYVSFPDSFWEDLSPELAFVARTFNDFCRVSGREDGYDGPRALDVMVEEKLPEVTKFGFVLERELVRLGQLINTAANEEEVDEEESVQREFVVEQMLHMALTFDYSDEVGRRKMSTLMRTALAEPSMPEEVTRLIVEILRLVCGDDARGERDFCGVVIEAIAEVHDTVLGDDETEVQDSSVEESFHSATSHFDNDDDAAAHKLKTSKKQPEGNPATDEEQAMREIVVNMKCLHIALCMLQNVQCALEDNVHLVTMLNNLVVPAVRSQEAPIRERGLCCLGLCCLLGKDLAQENLPLFLHCYKNGHPALKTIALHIITDIIITHPSLLAEVDAEVTTTSEQRDGNPLLKQILKELGRSLTDGDPTVQAAGANALSKAMLSRLINNTDLLKQLVVIYFDPDSASNGQLRQSLTYFLPVYCHSRAENAARMSSIVPAIISKLAEMREDFLEEAEAEDEEGDMVTLTVVSQILLDWTDPRKIVGFAEAVGTSSSADGAGESHFILTEHILERLTYQQVSKEEKKILISMLGKVHLPSGGCGVDRLTTIFELLREAIESGVPGEVAGNKNTFEKLRKGLLKQLNELMTAERGGGGAEETAVFDPTELPMRPAAVDVTETTEVEETTVPEVQADAGADHVLDSGLDDDDDDDDDDEDDVTRMGRTMGNTTIGAPDAEGTRLGLAGNGDTELLESILDSDEDL